MDTQKENPDKLPENSTDKDQLAGADDVPLSWESATADVAGVVVGGVCCLCCCCCCCCCCYRCFAVGCSCRCLVVAPQAGAGIFPMQCHGQPLTKHYGAGTRSSP